MIFCFLPPILLAAVFFDLIKRKIPNPLIACGLLTGAAYQWSLKSIPGMANFLGGILMPVFMLGILHYFRMLGAGDIKLLMVAGGFLGWKESIVCLLLSFVIAAVIAVFKLLKYRILGRRLRYFAQYLKNYRQKGKWEPYITGKEGTESIHFSVAVLTAAMILLTKEYF